MNATINSMNAIANLLVNNVAAASFVGVTTITTPKLKKGGNPFANEIVSKVTKHTLQFGYNYENAVNNRASDEFKGEFKALSLPWGEWVIPNKIISHKGELYARFYLVEGQRSEVAYFINDRVATESEVAIIRSLEPTRTDSARQSEVGVTNYCKPLTIKTTNIVELRIGGKVYEISEKEVAER